MNPPRRPTALLRPPKRGADRPDPGQRFLRSLHLLRVLVAATLEESSLPVDRDVSAVQMSLLRVIAKEGGASATIGDIARKLQVSAPAASKAVGRLVESGHVVTREDGRDARRLYIEVTETGQDAIRHFERARSRRADAILALAGPASAERWIKTLEELVGVLIDAGRRDDLPCLQCGLETPPTCAAESHGARCPVRLLENRRSRRRGGGGNS